MGTCASGNKEDMKTKNGGGSLQTSAKNAKQSHANNNGKEKTTTTATPATNGLNIDPTNPTLLPGDIELVRGSWSHVVKAGLRDYGVIMMMRIFIEHKEMKHLWRFARSLETAEQMQGSQLLRAHGEKLFNAIDLAVNSLNDLGSLVPVLVQLGVIHYKYGIREEHFPVVGEMLISTLKDGLKEHFPDPVKYAWLRLFTLVKFHMVVGMNQAATQMKQQQPDTEKKIDESCSGVTPN